VQRHREGSVQQRGELQGGEDESYLHHLITMKADQMIDEAAREEHSRVSYDILITR